jgi:flagellar hook-associated protein 3 FlgL
MNIGSSSIGAEWFLNGTATLQREEIRTQRQISSGFQVQDAADSPSQTPELIGLGSRLVATQAYQTNLGRIQAETSSADTALSAAIKLFDSARSLALQGAGTTVSAADRQNLATQVQSIQQQLVSLANSNTEGRFIFGGDQDLSVPYQLNAASTSGVDKLSPQTITRLITDLAGQPVYQARSAATIFDHTTSGGVPASDNAFAALQTLQVALQSNDSAGIANALNGLESAAGWLNQQQAAYGVDAGRISQKQSVATDQVTGLRTSISAIRDTDIVQAATDLAQETTAQSAAFAAQAQISRKSLFDYLG